jgi:hypothetical protein
MPAYTVDPTLVLKDFLFFRKLVSRDSTVDINPESDDSRGQNLQ